MTIFCCCQLGKEYLFIYRLLKKICRIIREILIIQVKILIFHLYIPFFFKIVGYNPGEQHLGKSKVGCHENNLGPQAGLHGQPDSHISGQGGPEVMGGKFYIQNYKEGKVDPWILVDRNESIL
jgi:hypothetical protein